MQLILTINAGSSTVKLAVFEIYGKESSTKLLKSAKIEISVDAKKLVERDFSESYDKNADVSLIIRKWLGEYDKMISGIGHRVVHGGNKYNESVAFEVNDSLIENITSYTTLAPLHQPHALLYIKYMKEAFPKVKQFACFDTSFHSTIDPIKRKFALPRKFSDEGVIRYGFHGLVYENIIHQLKDIEGASDSKIISIHLGNGCSACAIYNGKSIETSMGFTAIEGLMMGSRCGRIDPGVIFHMSEYYKMSMSEIQNILYSQSGLKGVSGISNDVRALLATNTNEAREAIELFCHMTIKEVFGLIGVLGGVDIITFTGGIGENAGTIRKKICDSMRFLGLKIDDELNGKRNEELNEKNSRISAIGSNITVLVLSANEEEVIARHVSDAMFINEVNVSEV